MNPRPLSEKIAGQESFADSIISRVFSTLNCCMPGIVQSFDKDTQTASIQISVRRRIRLPDGIKEIDYPLLTDVPVLMLGGGSSFITMPVASGDECLVIFADTGIDAWWQSGNVQNPIVARQHSLSDGFCIVGLRSKGKALQNFDSEHMEMSDFKINGVMFSDWARIEDEDMLVLGGEDENEIPQA